MGKIVGGIMVYLWIGALVVAVSGALLWREFQPVGGGAEGDHVTTFHSDTLSDEWLSETLFSGDVQGRIEKALALGVAAKLESSPHTLPENPEDIIVDDVIAATELLAALLGVPSEAFESHMQGRSRFLGRVLAYRQKQVDEAAYRAMVPDAVKLARAFQVPGFIEEYGFYNEDGPAFAASARNLEERLRLK